MDEMEPLFSRRRQRSNFFENSKLTNAELILLGTLILITLLVGVLTSVNLPEKFFRLSVDNYGDVVLDIVILFNLILTIVYLLHGIFFKQYFDILISSCSLGLVIIYVLVDFIYTNAINDALSVTRLVVISLSIPLIAGIIYVLTKNYLQDRMMMATKSIIRMYNSLNALFSLLKFDLQLNITFALFYLASDISSKSYKLFYIVFLIVFSIVQYIVGRLSLKKELVSTLYFYIFLYTIGIYFIQFEYFWKAKEHSGNSSLNYFLVNQSFLFTCLISLVVRVLTYIQVMNCYVNFNYGLTDSEFVNLAKNNGSLLGQRKRNRLMYM